MISSELEGVSVFLKGPAGRVFTSFQRGIDMLNVGYNYLDLIPGAEIRLAMNSLSSGCAAMMNELSPYAIGLEIIP